jgi:hypothetical protein
MQVSPRKRSPRAPSIDLEQALERVLRVYDQERLHAAPLDAVAQALGHKNANNGSAGATIASLRYFDLLERPKDGFLSVSKSVETYKYAPDEEMKRQIILEFLKKPPLYQELLDKYSVGLPSAATLKYELIQKGFLPQAVEAVLAAFVQSVSFARYFEEQSKNIQQEQPPSKSPHEEQSEILEDIRQPHIQQTSEAASMPSSGENFDQIPVRLSGGRKAWIVIPVPFFDADKARIKAQVDVLFADVDEKS